MNNMVKNQLKKKKKRTCALKVDISYNANIV